MGKKEYRKTKKKKLDKWERIEDRFKEGVIRKEEEKCGEDWREKMKILKRLKKKKKKRREKMMNKT